MNSFKGDAEKETDCDESHVRPTQKRWIADAVISWPNNDSLASIIEALQALNPQLGLRRAVDVRYGESEYLLYAGVWSDVFEIAFPSPASDDLMSGLTEVNREWWPIETDLGRFQYGPHRLERTSAGSVLVRPRSWHVCNEAGRFGMGYQHGTLRGQRSDLPFDQIGRVIMRISRQTTGMTLVAQKRPTASGGRRRRSARSRTSIATIYRSRSISLERKRSSRRVRHFPSSAI
jgi:hypothetical protein